MIKLEFKTRGKIIARYEVFSNVIGGLSIFCVYQETFKQESIY